jgi:Uma2 family endonuclease
METTMLRCHPGGILDVVSTTSATKLTYKDFLGFPDDGLRHELIDGAHYVSPSPTVDHQRVLRRLFAALQRCVEKHGLGEVFFAPCDVVLSNVDVLVPDLFVVLKEQADILTKANVRGAPALVVEVLSPGTRRRDIALKRRVYEARGVQEYWTVDPLRAVVTVHRRSGTGMLEPVRELGRADVLTSPLLPDLALDTSDVFTEPDRRSSRR